MCDVSLTETKERYNVVTSSTQVMTIMFEVQDLAVASPATVSRCGMVYLEPSILGLTPFVRCWLKSIPDAIKPHRERLETLFANYLEVHMNPWVATACKYVYWFSTVQPVCCVFMQPSIKVVRSSLKEIVPTTNGNLTFSLTKILDCFFRPFIPKEVRMY